MNNEKSLKAKTIGHGRSGSVPSLRRQSQGIKGYGASERVMELADI